VESQRQIELVVRHRVSGAITTRLGSTMFGGAATGLAPPLDSEVGAPRVGRPLGDPALGFSESPRTTRVGPVVRVSDPQKRGVVPASEQLR
jgi:hypothetical protein